MTSVGSVRVDTERFIRTRCQGCGHAANLHSERYGCHFQSGSRHRCLCYFSRTMAVQETWEAALDVRQKYASGQMPSGRQREKSGPDEKSPVATRFF